MLAEDLWSVKSSTARINLRVYSHTNYRVLHKAPFTLSRLRPRSSRLLNRNWWWYFWSNLPPKHDLIRLHTISDDCNTTDNDLVPVHIRSDTCGSRTWGDLVRSTTFQYVYIRPLSSVAIRNDCGCRLCRVAWCGKRVISHFLQCSQHWGKKNS